MALFIDDLGNALIKIEAYRIAPEAGNFYQDETEHWQAAQSETASWQPGLSGTGERPLACPAASLPYRGFQSGAYLHLQIQLNAYLGSLTGLAFLL